MPRTELLIASTVLCFLAVYAKSVSIRPAGDDWLLLHPVLQLLREHGFARAFFEIFAVAVGDFYRPLRSCRCCWRVWWAFR